MNTEKDSISWSELAELTHATQVGRFGWCICEGTDGEGQLADDCPQPCDCPLCDCSAMVEGESNCPDCLTNCSFMDDYACDMCGNVDRCGPIEKDKNGQRLACPDCFNSLLKTGENA